MGFSLIDQATALASLVPRHNFGRHGSAPYGRAQYTADVYRYISIYAEHGGTVSDTSTVHGGISLNYLTATCNFSAFIKLK